MTPGGVGWLMEDHAMIKRLVFQPQPPFLGGEGLELDKSRLIYHDVYVSIYISTSQSPGEDLGS